MGHAPLASDVSDVYIARGSHGRLRITAHRFLHGFVSDATARDLLAANFVRLMTRAIQVTLRPLYECYCLFDLSPLGGDPENVHEYGTSLLESGASLAMYSTASGAVLCYAKIDLFIACCGRGQIPLM